MIFDFQQQFPPMVIYPTFADKKYCENGMFVFKDFGPLDKKEHKKWKDMRRKYSRNGEDNLEVKNESQEDLRDSGPNFS